MRELKAQPRIPLPADLHPQIVARSSFTFTLSVLRAVREFKALQPRIPLPAEQVSVASTMPAKILHSVLRAVRKLKAPPRLPLPADLQSPMGGVVVSVMVHSLSVLRAVRELKALPWIPLPADLHSPMGVMVSFMVHTLSALRAVRELKA